MEPQALTSDEITSGSDILGALADYENPFGGYNGPQQAPRRRVAIQTFLFPDCG